MGYEDDRDFAEERANAADHYREMLDELREEQLDDMTRGYVECALWAGQNWSQTVDHGGEDDNPTPWDDEYSMDDIAEESLRVIRTWCEEFCARVREEMGDDSLDRWVAAGREHVRGDFDWGWVGHDFYLTRNGHGAGFWDRFFSHRNATREFAIMGDQLADIAATFGESDFYIHDAQLHVDS